MEMFDPIRELRGGGHARDGGGCYHLSFRSGSRGRGSCASAACDYITRTDEYDDSDRDPAIYTESDHMPSWALKTTRKSTGMPRTCSNARTGCTSRPTSRCHAISSLTIKSSSLMPLRAT